MPASVVRCFVLALSVTCCSNAIGAPARNRISGRVDSSRRVALTGHIPPKIDNAQDEGPVDPVATIASQYGALPRGLPMPSLPAVTGARLVELLPSAFTIAFLAAIESLLSAMVADRMVGGSHRPNAEVLAQGWANIGSALFGGLPATGAIARTATNVRAGGKTPVAGMIHALVILAVMLVAAPLGFKEEESYADADASIQTAPKVEFG